MDRSLGLLFNVPRRSNCSLRVIQMFRWCSRASCQFIILLRAFYSLLCKQGQWSRRAFFKDKTTARRDERRSGCCPVSSPSSRKTHINGFQKKTNVKTGRIARAGTSRLAITWLTPSRNTRSEESRRAMSFRVEVAYLEGLFTYELSSIFPVLSGCASLACEGSRDIPMDPIEE